MSKKVLLKDVLFNRAKVTQLAGELRAAHAPFDASAFVAAVTKKFPALELKARIAWMAECLRRFLPAEYREAVRVILSALPPPNNPALSDNDFGDFIHAPYCEFVARYGCTREDLTFSLRALRELTQRFSAEDAIRRFINEFPDETLRALTTWSNDSHYHVRRLCSEGSRPKLPWSQKLLIAPKAAIPILDRLYADRTRYVTRSVANHINDISKTDPALAIGTLARWKASAKQAPAEMDYIVRHGLRTLIKQGDSGALGLLGVSPDPAVRLVRFSVPAEVRMNSALEFTVVLQSSEAAPLIVDYIIYFLNKPGTPGGRKVFKLKTMQLASGERAMLIKRHTLREGMTTRALYRGRHALELQINGRSFGKKPFVIV